MTSLTPLPRILCLTVLLLGSLSAQTTAPVAGRAQTEGDGVQDLERFEGKEILSIGMTGLKKFRAEGILPAIETRRGTRLLAATVRDDLRFLWSKYKIKARFMVRGSLPGEKQGVHVRIVGREFTSYSKIAFRGLRHFTDEQVRTLLKIDEGEAPTELSAYNQARLLEGRYRQEGYLFAHVQIIPDAKNDILTLAVDEGPEVKVREIRFVGNRSYPTGAFLGLRWNLLGSAGVQSKPGMLSDAIFVQKNLDEDLDRLREWYRSRGFLDAVVELQKLDFVRDRTGVNISIRIIEGKRYRLRSVSFDQTPVDEKTKPAFSVAELRKVIQIHAGDYFAQERIERDQRQIAKHYGQHGFPRWQDYRNLDRSTTFDVLEPTIIVDPEAAMVDVVFRIQEGSPKRLRTVKIRGNTHTRDSVVRREISLLPGDDLDMLEFDKSRQRLLGLEYFGDRTRGDPGVRMDLLPVPGSTEDVDVEVELTEGSTGKVDFGAGYSTSGGIFGSIRYRKRNFDWSRPPSGWNPLGWFVDLMQSKAFHGGGQRLNLELMPGTQVSSASIDFYEPDVFGRQFDPIGMGLKGFRSFRGEDTYVTDRFGGRVRFDKHFGRETSVGIGFRQELIRVKDVDFAAPSLVWDAEGKTEVRSLDAFARFRGTDRRFRPTNGIDTQIYGELAPDWLNGQALFWRAGISGKVYVPLYEDGRGRRHVLSVSSRLDGGDGIGGHPNLLVTERFFLGGQRTLRGFERRGAGPMQFGNATGGELRVIGSLEYGFPIVSTRYEQRFEDTEVVRGVLFLDGGMLGNSFGDPLFRQPRASAGFGFRFLIPGLNVPIALDFAWPLIREATDNTRIWHLDIRF